MSVVAIILFVFAGLCFLAAAYFQGMAHGLKVARHMHEEANKDLLRRIRGL